MGLNKSKSNGRNEEDIFVDAGEMYLDMIGKDFALNRRIGRGGSYELEEVMEMYFNCVRMGVVLSEIDTNSGPWPSRKSMISQLEEYWRGMCSRFGVKVSPRDALRNL